MINLRTALKSYLKDLHPRVYFKNAPQGAEFPYLIYDFISYPDGEGFERIVLDIDGWDSNNTNDTSDIEALMDKLKPLNKAIISDNNISVSFYLDSKSTLTDEDIRIKRKKYIYQGKLYNKE